MHLITQFLSKFVNMEVHLEMLCFILFSVYIWKLDQKKALTKK